MPVRPRARGAGDPTQVIVETPTAPIPAADEPPPPGAPVEEPPPDRSLWPWLLVLLVLVLAALVGAWLAKRHNEHEASPRSPAAQTVAPATPTRQSNPERRISVPRVVGLKAPAALASLRRAHLTGTTHGVFSTKPRNQVVAQKPAASTEVKRSSTVALEVSKGQKPVPVPDVTGQQVAAALATIRAQGLRANLVSVPSDQPAGQVVAQHPRAASTAPASSAVRLNVSAGPPRATRTPAVPRSAPAASQVAVPDVRGEKVNEARKTLREAGLVTEIRRVPNGLPKNTVVDQSPKPDTSAKQGDHVLVTVSVGRGKKSAPTARTASVPDVSGLDEATATQELQAAGFRVRAVDQDTSDETQDGLVFEQDPPADQQAEANTTVTIYVGRFRG
jgi:beta-lactam-binding protein with PASTA domain